MAVLGALAGALGSVGSVIAPVLTVAGTVASIGAGMAQAKYQQQVAQQQADYSRRVAEQQSQYATAVAKNQADVAQLNINTANANARTAQENALRAQQAGQTAAQEQDQQSRALIAEQLGIQSASGLSLNSGSFLRTRKTARTLGRQDAMRAQAAGDAEARNYRIDAYNFATQAQSGAFAKNQALTEGAYKSSNALATGQMEANNAIATGQMAKMQSRYDAVSTGISGLSNFISLVGSSTPTRRTFNAYNPNPTPRARSIYS